VNGYPVYFASRERDGDGDGDGETTGAGDSTRRITRPGCKAWRHDAHREFPRFFRDVSRAFLMTHARLRRERAAAAAEGEGGDAGDVVRVSVVNDAAMDVEDAPVSSRTRARTRVSSAPAEAATVSSASGDEDDDEDDDDDDEKRNENENDSAARHTLGSLPSDVVHHIVKLAAPSVPFFLPVDDVRCDVEEAVATSESEEEVANAAADATA
jgi:hypothetical protein